MTTTRRGKVLEKTITELFKRYESKGIFCMRVHEAPHHAEKAPFDFIVYRNGSLHAFDTKECAGDAVNIKGNLKLHQVDAMCTIWKNGGNGFFMIYFKNHNKLTFVPVKQVLDAIAINKKSIHVDECEETSIDFLGEYK